MQVERQTATKAVAKAIDALVATEARSATVFLSDRCTVRVSRRMFGASRKRRRKFNRHVLDLVVTVGHPNHEAREFIKRAKAAGEPFPIKRPRLSFPKAR